MFTRILEAYVQIFLIGYIWFELLLGANILIPHIVIIFSAGDLSDVP